MRTAAAIIGSLWICASLTGCGGSRITHHPPFVEPQSEPADVVTIHMYEAASMGMWGLVFKDVSCHYRQNGGEIFATLQMDEVASDSNGVTYRAAVPGTSRGTTEYYFSWVDSSNKLRRVSAKSNYPQAWYEVVEHNRRHAQDSMRSAPPTTELGPPKPQ